MALSQAELLLLLADGKFDALIGEFESEWLECKSSPYQLEHDGQKLELAKDISGLANAEGGVLLLGFSTVGLSLIHI